MDNQKSIEALQFFFTNLHAQRSHTNIRFRPFVGASKEVTYLPVVR